MAERVAEIEERAHAGLRFILGDDARLGEAAHLDGAAAKDGVAGEDAVDILLEPLEEGGIPQRTILDDLGIACRQFAPRQRFEKSGVGEDG